MLQTGLPHSLLLRTSRTSMFPVLYCRSFRRALSSDENRPVSFLERARDFSGNTKELYDEYQRYVCIQEAKRSPLWNGRIPRRQQQQAVQIVEDLKVVLPSVLLCMVPIVGSFALLPVAMAPRQLLSRQFHNDFEHRKFAVIAAKQRQTAAIKVGAMFSAQLQLHPSDDMHQAFEKYKASETVQSLENIPTAHLVSLALSAGFAQRFPSWFSSNLADMMPSETLIRFTREKVQRLARDNRLLIEENQVEAGCGALTTEEVVDANLARCINTTGTSEEMRQDLTEYLKIVEVLSTNKTVSDLSFGLFCMHIMPLKLWDSNL